MIYPCALALVGTITGVIYVATHGWVFWQTAPAAAFLSRLPRHKPLGWALLAAATLWFALLLGTIDLMEYTPHRHMLVLAVVVLGVLSGIYLTEFLTARAFGALLILASQILLDAAFLHDTPSRLVVTLTAYAWIVAGMFLVGMPYLLRDIIAWLGKDFLRLKWAAGAGAAWGVLLLVLGLFFYPW